MKNGMEDCMSIYISASTYLGSPKNALHTLLRRPLVSSP
jgi:hypothetical protein